MKRALVLPISLGVLAAACAVLRLCAPVESV